LHIEGESANSAWFVTTQKHAQGSNQKNGADNMKEVELFSSKEWNQSQV